MRELFERTTLMWQVAEFCISNILHPLIDRQTDANRISGSSDACLSACLPETLFIHQSIHCPFRHPESSDMGGESKTNAESMCVKDTGGERRLRVQTDWQADRHRYETDSQTTDKHTNRQTESQTVNQRQTKRRTKSTNAIGALGWEQVHKYLFVYGNTLCMPQCIQ